MNDELGTLTLQNRPHATRADDKCMSELVDWMAGKSDSNLPACVSPVLADFGKAWKDGMRSDEEREQLREYVPLLVGTASANVDLTRSRMAFSWLIREYTPAWLRLSGFGEHADRLATLPDLAADENLLRTTQTINAAKDAAKDVAGNPVRAAARIAAGAPAGAAARAAAMVAARTAGGIAAWNTWVAAWFAGGITVAAAGENDLGSGAAEELGQEVAGLQQSAHVLYRRMIAGRKTKTPASGEPGPPE